MSDAYVCDRDGCDSWQRRDQMRSGWLAVEEMGIDRQWHFCSHDCLLQFFAARPPGEVVSPWSSRG